MKRSGKYAYVDGVPCTQAWQISQANSASKYAASCVPDATAAVPGNLDQTGTISGMGYLPFLPVEDDYAFVGVASGKTGELVNYLGDILVSEATLSIPVEAGTPIVWTSNFGVQGLVTKETATLYEDDTRNPAVSAKFGHITIETAPSVWTPVEAVQNITIVFRRPPVTSVEDGATFREAGNLEVDLSFEVRNDDFMVTMYDSNVVARVRVYVTATLFYMFDAIIFKDKTNFVVDRRNNTMIGYTVNGFWTALKSQVTPVLGTIILPDSSVLYPAA